MGLTSQGLRATACAALATVMLGATVEAAGEGIRLAQARAPMRPSNEAREEDNVLDVLKKLSSGCVSAAWTLWHSNSYESWRSRKSSMINMHLSAGHYPSLPAVPAIWPADLRAKADASMKQANDTLREAGEAFKQLATYINAKDYEDDKFKKGDELNAKILAYGKTCHTLGAELMGQYTQAATLLIERRKANAAKPDVVATMIGDWQRAQALSSELARHEKADPLKLDSLAKDISALAEDRMANFEPLKQNPDPWVKRFYDNALNNDVAVKMRRLLRDAKTPKAFKDVAEDRPRSTFWTIRSEIDVTLPDAILRYIRYGK